MAADDGPHELAVRQGRHHNLVLGVAQRGIVLPLFWSELDKPGNAELADRERVGEAWFRWLQRPGVPCHQRLKRRPLIPHNAWNRRMRLDTRFGSLQPWREPPSARAAAPLWGGFVRLTAHGTWRKATASSSPPPARRRPRLSTPTPTADRWPVETRFGGLKRRGFNFEDTHLTDPTRLSKLMGRLALAFAWTYRTGELRHDGGRPIPLKKLQHPLKSRFRHGLDCLRNIALNLAENSRNLLGP